MPPDIAQLDRRVASALGWPIADVHTFTAAALRDLLLPVDLSLASEITLRIRDASLLVARRRRA